MAYFEGRTVWQRFTDDFGIRGERRHIFREYCEFNCKMMNVSLESLSRDWLIRLYHIWAEHGGDDDGPGR